MKANKLYLYKVTCRGGEAFVAAANPSLAYAYVIEYLDQENLSSLINLTSTDRTFLQELQTIELIAGGERMPFLYLNGVKDVSNNR